MVKKAATLVSKVSLWSPLLKAQNWVTPRWISSRDTKTTSPARDRSGARTSILDDLCAKMPSALSKRPAQPKTAGPHEVRGPTRAQPTRR